MEYPMMARAPRKALRGKGPTPKAKDRPYHKAAKANSSSRKQERTSERSRPTSRPDSRTRTDSRSRPDSRSRANSRPIRGEEREKVHVDSIAGRNVVLEALRAGIPAKELVVAVGIDIDDRIREIVDLAKSASLPIREVPRNRLDTLTGIAHHQGIALIARPFQYSSEKEIFQRAEDPALYIAVDGITDPRNIGAIIRSAAAFGADGILIPERRSAGITAAAWKASAGAVARIPVAQVTNLVRSIENAKERGCFIVGLEGGSDDTLETMKIADQSLYIVVGSEGKGLSRLVKEKCDLLLSIPISSKVESLNASVAVSIALYGIAARRRSASKGS
jgi:23S rRNA (guanosine2251-2'-O)-methyltransferase